MEILFVDLKNCWGIEELNYEFNFSGDKNKAYSIYAPNGVMKTSFAKTFIALSKGESPKEERYGRKTTYTVEADGKSISQDEIFVLESEIDRSKVSKTLSNILVNPQYRDRYNELIVDINERKKALVRALQKQSKVSTNDIETTILNDMSIDSFPRCVELLLKDRQDITLEKYEYLTLFDHRAVAVLNNADFQSNAVQFIERYQTLFDKANDLYEKGVFNPIKADSAFSELKKQGYFQAGHRVYLKGDNEPMNDKQLEERLKKINELIDGDKQLKKIKDNLAKNAQTKTLMDLIETLSATEIDFLLNRIKPENQNEFRKQLWAYYIQNSHEANTYIQVFKENESELIEIEKDAAKIAQTWLDIVALYNDRFVDMPFMPEIANQAKVVIGQEGAEIIFKFRDGEEIISCASNDERMKTLSTGEERALNLLYFIFEVESRKINKTKTLFVIDDIADSFDYKNKHAIILYLRDLCETDHFRLILLTHNFDFFRAVSKGFVHRSRCLLTSWDNGSIFLYEAQGIENVFINMWKKEVENNDTILYATVPFTRNLIEYTKESGSADFKKLTSLLHWKEDTCKITINDYMDIYNIFFGTNHPRKRNTLMIDLLYQQSDLICKNTTRSGFNLEEKVLLSIAIRIYAEQFMVEAIRILRNDPTYWFEGNNQFGLMYEELKKMDPNLKERAILDKVSVTVSSNIHLNSFMYEPILDLSIDYLVCLYKEVRELVLLNP